MPLFSCFTPFGAGFAFSGAPSHGETIYRSMLANLGNQLESFSTEEGTRMRAFCYASAMMAARVLYTLEHAGFQLDPLKVTEMLPLREGEYGLIPGPNESWDDRRAAIAARLLAPKGGWYNNIKNALLTLLGTDFVQYIPTAYADASVFPPNCGDQPMNLVTANKLPILVRITDGISTGLGSPKWVTYEVIAQQFIPDPTDGSTLPPRNLVVGDTIVVEPGHNVRHETVQIVDLIQLGTGVLQLRATFNQPHDPNALAASLTYPYWLSTKRFNLVVLEAAAAADPETRRKVNELLDRMVRAVSTWAIVQEDPANPGHTGVFLADTSGSDTQTMGDVVVPP